MKGLNKKFLCVNYVMVHDFFDHFTESTFLSGIRSLLQRTNFEEPKDYLNCMYVDDRNHRKVLGRS